MGIVTGAEFKSDCKSDVDYLVFWGFGKFDNQHIFNRLESVFVKASETKEAMTFRVGGFDFSMSPFSHGTGVHRQKIVLDCQGIQIGICRQFSDKDRPALKVEMRGAAFSEHGFKRAIKLVKNMLNTIGFKYERSQVQRVDLKADFSTFTAGDVFDLYYNKGCMVTKAAKFDTIMRGHRTVETFYVGLAKSDVCCRFYDKIRQLGKDREHEALLITGGEEVETLTRCEYQVKRNALRKNFGIDSVEDLLAGITSLVDKLTSDWLRIQNDTVDRRCTQRGKKDLHKIWRLVRAEFLKLGRRMQRGEKRSVKKMVQSSEAKKNAVCGYVASIAAETCRTFASVTEFCEYLLGVFGHVGYTLGELNDKIIKKAKQYRVKTGQGGLVPDKLCELEWLF